MTKFFFFVLLLLLAAGGWLLYQNPKPFALKSVVVHGKLQYLDKQALLNDIKPLLRKNIWRIKVDKIEQVLRAEPWVASVTVKRELPGQLRLQVKERQPIGVWGKFNLVDEQFHVFSPNKLPDVDPPLLRFSGIGDPKSIVMVCRRMQNQLEGTDIKISHCMIDERGAWSLRFNDGHKVLLGKHKIASRLAHLVALWPKISEVFPDRHFLDFRYRHGFSLR